MANKKYFVYTFVIVNFMNEFQFSQKPNAISCLKFHCFYLDF